MGNLERAKNITTMEKLVQGTVQNSTSGTAIDFTGIPSWVKKITVMFNGVSTNGSSLVQVQLGSVAIKTTGYVGSTALVYGSNQTVVNSSTTGIPLYFDSSVVVRTGTLSISNFLNNTWVASGVLGSGATSATAAGSVTLSGTLDRIRITTVNEQDTFDAGQINIMYEG